MLRRKVFSVIMKVLPFRARRLVKKIAQVEVSFLEECFPDLFLMRTKRGRVFNPREIRPCPCGYSLDQLPLRRDIFRCQVCGRMKNREELEKWSLDIAS